MFVTPRITPDGMIIMEIVAEKSEFTGEGVPVLIDGATGNVIESPIKDLSVVRTTVSVANNQTIVLGGMITKSDQTITRKVPWLGDLPILGKPFRYDSTSSLRTELLIFLTPRIIRHDADSEMIKQIEIERMTFTEEAAEEIHGPLFALPEEADLMYQPQPEDGQSLNPLAPPAAEPPSTLMPPPASPLQAPARDQYDDEVFFPNDSDTLQQTLMPIPGDSNASSKKSRLQQTNRKKVRLTSFLNPFRTKSSKAR